MRNRYLYGSGLALLAILLMLVFWQVSLSFGDYGPETTAQTFVFWGVSTLIFLLTVTVGFMLFREGVRLYMDRQSHREGSRIKSKMVLGALALSLLPVMFMLAFSYVILNRNVEKWFSRPAEGIRTDLLKSANAFDKEVQDRAQALANWIATLPAAAGGKEAAAGLCQKYRIAEIRIEPAGENFCPPGESGEKLFEGRAALPDGRELVVGVHRAADLAAQSKEIARYMAEYNQIAAERNNIRKLYLLFLVLIALFVLFVATWIALKLSHHISVPISALLVAASEVRKGNLGYRVRVRSGDELATLIRAFNEMMQELEANSRELESRRRFTEAILESIPTGVLSLASDGRIQRVNRALHGLFPEDRLASALYLSDLFPSQDAAELEYLMKRARRTGVAASQIEIESPQQVLHLAVTVSALPARHAEAPGYVVVLEDTSELLRAQKAAAWHEVARRIAHELKNPLTPIALSAERIARLLDRGAAAADSQGTLPEKALRALRECSATISREVESVKTLADEFSHFSRFPAAQPVPASLNEVVRHGVDVFAGRLDGIDLRLDLAPGLPLVNIDPEQFQRVVVNLVDNAAEAMRDSLVKRLLVATRATSADTVELLVADTGCGISPGDKEKLFLPYFSTKGRGTGLGLAIVSHILSEHGARIRVEDNRPAGARFYVEVPVAVAAEANAS